MQEMLCRILVGTRTRCISCSNKMSNEVLFVLFVGILVCRNTCRNSGGKGRCYVGDVMQDTCRNQNQMYYLQELLVETRTRCITCITCRNKMSNEVLQVLLVGTRCQMKYCLQELDVKSHSSFGSMIHRLVFNQMQELELHVLLVGTTCRNQNQV